MTEGPTSRYVSIADAASLLGIKPWDVVRLVESQRLAAVQMVDVNSIASYQKGNR